MVALTFVHGVQDWLGCSKTSCVCRVEVNDYTWSLLCLLLDNYSDNFIARHLINLPLSWIMLDQVFHLIFGSCDSYIHVHNMFLLSFYLRFTEVNIIMAADSILRRQSQNGLNTSVEVRGAHDVTKIFFMCLQKT